MKKWMILLFLPVVANGLEPSATIPPLCTKYENHRWIAWGGVIPRLVYVGNSGEKTLKCYAPTGTFESGVSMSKYGELNFQAITVGVSLEKYEGQTITVNLVGDCIGGGEHKGSGKGTSVFILKSYLRWEQQTYRCACNALYEEVLTPLPLKPGYEPFLQSHTLCSEESD